MREVNSLYFNSIKSKILVYQSRRRALPPFASRLSLTNPAAAYKRLQPTLGAGAGKGHHERATGPRDRPDTTADRAAHKFEDAA